MLEEIQKTGMITAEVKLEPFTETRVRFRSVERGRIYNTSIIPLSR